MQLFERFRPKSFDQIAGQRRAKDLLLRIRQAGGFGGRSFWLVGPSGTGKTTIANLVAAELADPVNVLELDASDATPARLGEIERASRTLAIGDKPGRAVIINEAHGLRKDAVRKLLTTLERIPGHVVWIFTTTDAGMQSFDGIDADPLLSRTLQITLQPNLKAFARRAKQIAERIGLGGAKAAAYLRLAKECRGNLRMMLSRIEAGEMLEA